MSKSDWKEDKIEKLLKELPKVTDNRDPKDLYHQISSKLKKKKRTVWIVPGFASVAAIILFFILGPGLSDWNRTSNKELSMDSKELVQTEDNAASLKMENVKPEHSELAAQDQNQVMAKTAVYKEDLVGNELLFYGIPDRDAQNVVQISVLVKVEDSKSWFDQFLETMPKLTEEKWGLSDYFPLNGDLTFNSEQKVVNLDLPEDHQYGQGSASESIFENSLKTTFENRSEVNQLTFTTAKNPGVRLGNKELQQIDLSTGKNEVRPYFLLYLDSLNRPLFVQTQDTIASPEAAFLEMRKEIPTKGLKASIPEKLQFDEILAKNNQLTIFVRKGSVIPQTAEMLYGLEAILLIAKDFGFETVEIKYAASDQIGPFRLNQAIEVPVAANKTEIQ